MSKVLVPIHAQSGDHFSLACINVEARRIEYYDSMEHSPEVLRENHEVSRLTAAERE